MKDVFEMFRTIALERKRREVDPTLRLINDCLAEPGKPKAGDAHVRERLEAMKEFFELALTFAAQMDRMSTPSLVRVAKMGDKALKLLGT